MKRHILLFLSCFLIHNAFADEPEVLRHVDVYKEEGRFGGWPANHGIWLWGDEILVGFSRGYYKDLGEERHNIDRERPEEHLFARSRDGGMTWSIENPAEQGKLIPYGQGIHGVTPPELKPEETIELTKPLQFTHPDFTMTIRMRDVDVGPSDLYYSYDRGHSWEGPVRLKVGDLTAIAARTDYIVEGPQECTLFLTAPKTDGEEGRPFCARTNDGGMTWDFVSWIGPEPAGFSIMPSSVRLSENDLVVAVRRREPDRRWIEVYRSEDNGETWSLHSQPMEHVGHGNPPSLIRLQDGRLCLTYGLRAEPWEIRAQLSDDGGQTWGEPITLRGEGGGRDMGYVRTVQRPDGNIVTVYYFQDKLIRERYIAATIWKPGNE